MNIFFVVILFVSVVQLCCQPTDVFVAATQQQAFYLDSSQHLTPTQPTSSFALAIPINQTSSDILLVPFKISNIKGTYDEGLLSTIQTSFISLSIDAEPGVHVQASLRVDFSDQSFRKEVFTPMSTDSSYGTYQTYVETLGLASSVGSWMSTSDPFNITVELWVVQGFRPALVLTLNSYVMIPYTDLTLDNIPVLGTQRKAMLSGLDVIPTPYSTLPPPFPVVKRNKFFLQNETRRDHLNLNPTTLLLNYSATYAAQSTSIPFPHPFPTNAWWMNAVLQSSPTTQGTDPLFVIPYIVHCDACGINFNKGFVDSAETAVFTSYSRLFRLSFDSSQSSSLKCQRTVNSFDHLSVTMRYHNLTVNGTSQEYIEAPLIRGSPYVSMYYNRMPVMVELSSQLIRINDIGVVSGQGPMQVSHSRFILTLTSGDQWAVFFSFTVTITFQNGPQQQSWSYLKLPRDYIGWVRVAFVYSELESSLVPKQRENFDALEGYASCVVIGGHVTHNATPDAFADMYVSNYTSLSSSTSIKFQYQLTTQRTCTPLMLAMAHHTPLLTAGGTYSFSDFQFYSIHGLMRAVVGARWSMSIDSPAVQLRDLLFLEACQRANLNEAFEMDQYVAGTISEQNPYQAFKQFFRLARLIQSGEELGKTAVVSNLRKVLAANIETWLNGTSANHFTYDPIWGGILTARSATDVRQDYGYGWYNDHHYAAGYFLYSVAVLLTDAEYTGFFQKYKEHLNAIARDIANPSSDDLYFTPVRHFDWYRGHSWASGILSSPEGRNQESSSEAAFAYYAVAMYGKVTKNKEMHMIGRMLSALETNSAQFYWQVNVNETTYPEIFAKGRVVGILYELRVTRRTYFLGNNNYGAHFIQFLPFTPYSRVHINPKWVKSPSSEIVIIAELLATQTVLDNIWRAFYALALAFSDPSEAWRSLQLMSSGWFDVSETRSSGFLFTSSYVPSGITTYCLEKNPLPVLRSSRLLFNGSANYLFRIANYMPTPIGKDPYEDKVYSTRYSSLHSRDLKYIKEGGFNTVQVLAPSTDGLSSFVSLCEDHGLFVILTFYLSLDNGIDPSAIETQWRRFLTSYSTKQNIVMWAIGSPEILDNMPASDYATYFAAVLRLQNVRDREDRLGGRPIIIPVSDSKYSAVVALYDDSVEVWQVTVYHATDITKRLVNENTGTPYTNQPLIVSLVADAYSVFSRSTDEAAQSRYIMRHVPIVHDWWRRGLASGVQIIEWSDQWWKGKLSGYDSDCPESNPSKHSTCGIRNDNVPDTYINQEYLGIVAQKQGWLQHCIKPRRVFYDLAVYWVGFRDGPLTIKQGQEICVWEPLIFPMIVLYAVTGVVLCVFVLASLYYYHKLADRVRRELKLVDDLEAATRTQDDSILTSAHYRSWAQPNFYFIQRLVRSRVQLVMRAKPFEVESEPGLADSATMNMSMRGTKVFEGSHKSYLIRRNIDQIIRLQANHIISLIVDEMLCQKKIDTSSLVQDYGGDEHAYYDAFFDLTIHTLHFRFLNSYNGWQDAQIRLAQRLGTDFTYLDLTSTPVTSKLGDLLLLFTIWQLGEHMTRFSPGWLSWCFHHCRGCDPPELPPDSVVNDFRHFKNRDVTFDDIDESCVCTPFFPLSKILPPKTIYPSHDLVRCKQCKANEKVTEKEITLGTSSDFCAVPQYCSRCHSRQSWEDVPVREKKVPRYDNFPFTRTFREPRKAGVFFLILKNYWFIVHMTVLSFTLWSMLCNDVSIQSTELFDVFRITNVVTLSWIATMLAKIDVWLCLGEEMLDVYFTLGMYDIPKRKFRGEEKRTFTWMRIQNSITEYFALRWANLASFLVYWPLLGESTFSDVDTDFFYVCIYICLRISFIFLHNMMLFTNFPRKRGHPRYRHSDESSLVRKWLYSFPASIFWLLNYSCVQLFQLWMQFQMRRMDFELCVCGDSADMNATTRRGLFDSMITLGQATILCFGDRPRCMLALFLLWLIVFVVQLVMLQVSFYIWSMLFGIVSGVIDTWKSRKAKNLDGKKLHAATILRHINTKMLGFVDPHDTSLAVKIWNRVVSELYQDHLLSMWEMSCLRMEPNTQYIAFRIESSFAADRLTSFLQYIEDYPRESSHVDLYSVLLYDSISVVIPVYGEPVLAENSINSRRQWRKQHRSQLHFLVDSYPDEWRNFCEYMISFKNLFLPPIITEEQYVYFTSWKHECTKFFKLSDEDYESCSFCPGCSEEANKATSMLAKFAGLKHVPPARWSAVSSQCDNEKCGVGFDVNDPVFLCLRCNYIICESCNAEAALTKLMQDLKGLDRPVEKVRRATTPNNTLIEAVAKRVLEQFHIVPDKFSDVEREAVNWWASMRMQTVARTVRGAEKKREAFHFMLSLETEYTEAHHIYTPSVLEQIAVHKFQTMVCCQILPDAKWWRANVRGIIALVRRYPHVDLVFDIDFTKKNNDPKVVLMVIQKIPEDMLVHDERSGQSLPVFQFASCVMKHDPETNGLRIAEVIFRENELRPKKNVKLGLNGFMQGKPVNQGHSLPFVRNQILQALDSNQDGYFEEALKLRSVLRIFYRDDETQFAKRRRNDITHEQLIAYTKDEAVLTERFWSYYKIVGFREYIVTRQSGTLGRYTSYAEYVFVSIFQRVLSFPLGVRMHYGHPDFFDASWAITQGGMSKPNPLINLNEDIFAGYNIKMNGERVIHVEFMLEGKGRETNFDGGNGFEAKLAMGAAMQFRTRDVFELNRRLNVVERHSLLFGTIGYYIFSSITVALITFHILTHILLHLAGVSAYDLGVRGSPFATEWVMQLGMVQSIPLLAQLAIDYGMRGVFTYIRDVLGVTMYFTFCLMTKHYWFMKSSLNGNADYIATGRSDPLVRLSFKHFFRFYGYTHFMHALFMLVLVTMYGNISGLPTKAVLLRSVYTITTAVIWICSPVIFNAAQSFGGVWFDFSRFFNWIFSDSIDHVKARDEKKRTREAQTAAHVSNDPPVLENDKS
eukprot:PhM_4_TR3103/c0_g1_i1/m.61463